MDEEKDNKDTVSQIIQDADGKFNITLPATGSFDRKCRRRIESNTETIIKMPRKMPYTKPGATIQIFGPTLSSVESARNEIENIIALQRRRYTHFISIPIDDEGVVEKFIQFKNEVSQMDNTTITDEYFQKTYKLHLTFGVLSLFNDERKNSAVKTLHECQEIIDRAKTSFNEPGDLRINISGVNCMDNNPSNCKILYGIVDSKILQTIANEMAGHFISKGLMENDKNEVKLHITMMNIVFNKRITGKRTKKFDASGIVEKFSNYNFGYQKIDQIHLSRFERTGEFSYYQSDEILNV